MSGFIASRRSPEPASRRGRRPPARLARLELSTTLTLLLRGAQRISQHCRAAAAAVTAYRQPIGAAPGGRVRTCAAGCSRARPAVLTNFNILKVTGPSFQNQSRLQDTVSADLNPKTLLVMVKALDVHLIYK
ncbi:hypothetical protein EVAR_31087_1 [Eumeta japonica]|uniref:Uncharacterized protein n=1 Tax=Eumeta variegata TaxID=151549 RepID=A0A4C1XHI8_EUMVA|nr:hypothetical protein EVAR_31087_1 [Eumeta japonica]